MVNLRRILAIEFSHKRVYGLDILRAFAIIVVVMAHGAKILPTGTYRFHDYFLVDGVSLFFVLSGFLIGGILIKILENNKATTKNLLNFWIRRWFRTLPVYFLILSILVFMRLFFYGGFQGTEPWRYFLFFQNFNFPHPVFFSEAWTLSVEEWFYLLIPAIVFCLIGILRIVPKRAILLTASTIIVASVIFRLHRYSALHVTSIADWDLYFRKQVITRLDSLMFGVIGAYLAFYNRALWIKHKVALFWAGLALIAGQQVLSIYAASGANFASTGFGIYLSVFSFTVMALATLMLMPALSEYKAGKGRLYVALTYISIASYSMYLIHVSLVQPLVFSATGTAMSAPLIVLRYGLYWLLTITCSILLFKYFEKPVTDLREKAVRKRSPTPSVEPVEMKAQQIAGSPDA